MAQKINYTDILNLDQILNAFDQIQKAIQSVNIEINKLTKGSKTVNISGQYEKAAKASEKLGSEEKKLAKIMADRAKIQEQLLKEQTNKQTELIRQIELQKNIMKELAITENKTSDSYLNAQKKLNELTDEYKKLNKEQSEHIKNAKREEQISQMAEGSLEQLRANLAKLRGEYVKLSAQERESDIGKAMLKNIKDLDNNVKKIEGTLGQFQRNVGNYKSALSGLTTILSGVGIGLGIESAISAVGNALKEGIQTIKEYEVSLARLQSVTGITDGQLRELSSAVIDLSAKYGIAAKDISENLTLIGSKQPELLKNKEGMLQLADAAIKLAQASGAELPETTSQLLTVMNQWGANAKEAAYYTDVLSNAAQLGAAEIPQLADAMGRFGGIAKLAGVDVKESAAMIEILAKTMKTDEPEKMGTGIRNLLSVMNAAGAASKPALKAFKEAEISIGVLQNPTLSVSERMRELSKLLKGIDSKNLKILTNDFATAEEKSAALTAIMKSNNQIAEVFGKENLEVGIKLLSNVDSIDKLVKAYDTKGTTEKQQIINTNTLQSSLDKLSKTWDAQFLKANQEGGFSKMLKALADGLTVVVANSDKVLESLSSIFGFNPFAALEEKSKQLGYAMYSVASGVDNAGQSMLGLANQSGAAASQIIDNVLNQNKEVVISNLETTDVLKKEHKTREDNEDTHQNNLLKLQKDYANLKIQSIKDDQERALAELQQSTLANLETFNISAKFDGTQLTTEQNLTQIQKDALLLIEQNFVQKKLEINEKYNAEKAQKDLETFQKAQAETKAAKEIELYNELALLTDKEQIAQKEAEIKVELNELELTQKKELYAKLLTLGEDYNTQAQTVQLEISKETAENQKELIEKQLAEQEKALSDYAKRLQDLSDTIQKETGLSITAPESQDKTLSTLKENYKKASELLKEQREKDLITETDFEKAKDALDQDFGKKRGDRIGKIAAMYSSYAQTAQNAISQIIDNRLYEADKKREEELKKVEIFEARGVMSKEVAEREKALIEEKYTEESKKIKKKFADIQFAITISQIIADTAAGVAAAWTNPLTAPFLTPLIIAQGAISAAAAFAERKKIKQLKHGEIMIQGEGTETSDSIPAMLSKNESVINAKSSKNSSQLLTLINKGKLTDSVLPLLHSKIDLSQNNQISTGQIEFLLQKNNALLTETVNAIKKQPLHYTTKSGSKAVKIGESTTVFV